MSHTQSSIEEFCSTEEFHSVGHSDISDSTFGLFIWNEVPYYMRQFAKFSSAGDKYAISWNWASALLGSSWVFYRKMYLFGFIIFGAKIIIACIYMQYFIGYNKLLKVLFDVLFFLLYGICGNYLYYKHATNKLSNLWESTHETPQETIQELGGTSGLSVLIYLIISTIIYSILGYFYLVSVK